MTPAHSDPTKGTLMLETPPVLITGAAGHIGGVSRTTVDMLLEQGLSVRAFVRRDDERADSLRGAGADVFVGDLLNMADVTAALKGRRRVYMEWSPQQRAHWVTERVLERSGLPTVNIRGAMFVENPLLTRRALESLSKGELRLSFGEYRLAPVAGYDVAEDFVAVLGHPVTYVPEDVETWNATFVDGSLAELPHTAQHMKALARLIGGGYRGATAQLETLLGRPPKSVRWSLENHPRIQESAAALSR